MRRLLAPLAAALALLPGVLVLPAAAQQTTPDPEQDTDTGTVRLALVSQRPYATTDRPLRVRVRAVNETATTFRDLRLSLAVYPAVRSRSEYGQALEVEPPVIAVGSRTFPVRGALRPGETITVAAESGLGFLEGFEGNTLHPVEVVLASEFAPIAVLRTMVVFVREEPKVPLNVALSFVLDAPLRMLPHGRFSGDALEAEIAAGSRLDTILNALARFPAPATLVVSPVLLVQLERMADGYEVVGEDGVRRVPPDDPLAERAAVVLRRIQAVARDPVTEVVALPYAAPSVPALVAAGRPQDLDAQVDLGRSEVERLLGVAPVASLLHPPGSALTPESVPALASLGVQAVVVGPETLPPPEGVKFTPSPTTELSAQGATVLAIAPDPVVALRAGAEHEGAVLRAQWMLGELTAIYGELPSRDRGVAVLFDGEAAPEPAFLGTLLRALTRTPAGVGWLRPVKATRLLTVPPAQGRDLVAVREGFSSAYLAELAAAEEAVARFTAVAAQPAPMRDRLRRMVLLSQHRAFLAREEEALAYLGRVREVVEAEFAKVELPPPNSVTTLTSRGGSIPLTIHKAAQYDMRVVVRLGSPLGRLRFVGGPVREVVLSQPTQRLTFPVQAHTTGRFPVTVELMTPQGDLIGSSQIVVRSTAYNRIALIVTIGAALFLAAVWARRFLPRRT
ncbi:MAG TPA: DUF6049 family protein [Actinomycetota bacterium]|nr:DUF6049 family protein [Actinomycetota bacterium]